MTSIEDTNLTKYARLILLYIGLFGLTISLLSLTGRFFWVGEALSAFRLQLLAATVIGCLLAIPVRTPYLTAVCCALLLINGGGVATRLLQKKSLPPVAANTPARLSLISANLLYANTTKTKALRLIAAQKPDIFIAIEATEDWLEPLKPLKTLYPYHYYYPKGPDGFFVFSKQPFQITEHYFGGAESPALRLDFGEYVVWAVHPWPPYQEKLYAAHRAHLLTLAEVASREQKPVIIAGDFNATLWSSSMSPFLDKQYQWPSHSGMRHTWPVNNAIMATQIDQVLTRGAIAANYEVLGDIGSDHYPVRADIVF